MLQEGVQHPVAAGALHHQHVRSVHARAAPARLGAVPHLDHLAFFGPLHFHNHRHDEMENGVPQEHSLPR